MRYYDKDGYKNGQAFKDRLQALHNEVENGANLNELLKIRNKLYALKRKYEESGTRVLECEFEIMAVNEIIQELRNMWRGEV